MGESRSNSQKKPSNENNADQNVRMLSRPISPEHLINAQRKSFWPYLCLVVALILLLVVGYFAWFFQNQNLLLQERFDNIQTQVNVDYKNTFLSTESLNNKSINKWVQLNLRLIW